MCLIVCDQCAPAAHEKCQRLRGPLARIAHHPVPLDVLDGGFEVGVRVRGIIRDLRGDILLSPSEQGDVMALLH